MRKAKRYRETHTTGKLDLQTLYEATLTANAGAIELLKREAQKVLGQDARPRETTEVVARIARAMYEASTLKPGCSTSQWKDFCFNVAGRQPLAESIRRDFPISRFTKSY